ncbi:MAG: AzlC family ABC transporter permease [Dermatophilaceae bacterium]
MRSRLDRVARQSLSVGVATGAYGVSFGALSVAAGLSVAQTMALSLLMFSGASQFAVVAILGGGGAGVTAISTAGLLGIRNGLYGLQMSHVVGGHGPVRLLAAQLTIDESTAVGMAQGDARDARRGFWLTGAAVFVLWNLMTWVGALAGNALDDPTTYGLDAAVAGAFCGLLWPRLRHRDALLTAVLAAFLAMVTAPLLPTGVPILVGAIAALVVALAPTRRGRDTS